MNEKYANILHMKHHVSKNHPQMPMADRAAQFSPFAALTGHDAAISEAGRLTDRKIELDEYELAAIDSQLQQLRDELSNRPEVAVTWFEPDTRKDGGKYVTSRMTIKKIDEIEGTLVAENGKRIPIQDIYEIEIVQHTEK